MKNTRNGKSVKTNIQLKQQESMAQGCYNNRSNRKQICSAFIFLPSCACFVCFVALRPKSALVTLIINIHLLHNNIQLLTYVEVDMECY